MSPWNLQEVLFIYDIYIHIIINFLKALISETHLTLQVWIRECGLHHLLTSAGVAGEMLCFAFTDDWGGSAMHCPSRTLSASGLGCLSYYSCVGVVYMGKTFFPCLFSII